MRKRISLTTIAVALFFSLTGTASAREGARITFAHATQTAMTAAPLLAPLPPAPADTVWLHIAGEPVSPHVERALIDQIDEVAPVWHTPPIRFGASGIPVYVLPGAQVWPICGSENAGCHVQDQDPAIYVEDFRENVTDGPQNRNSITSSLSHEIIEALVDPDGMHPEICDPVAWTDYKVDGVAVDDWTLPAYWTPASPPPYDFLRTLDHANA